MPRPRRPSKIILPKEIKIDLVDKDFEQILKFFPKQNHEVVLMIYVIIFMICIE